ncbi:MAG: hypothetical protein AAF802_04335 [Planctomycetota bacterium]
MYFWLLRLKWLSFPRFTIVSYSLAITLAIVAAIVNVFVGPLTHAMWILPPFLLGFLVITLIATHAFVQETQNPIPNNWMVRATLGKDAMDRFKSQSLASVELGRRFALPIFTHILPLFGLAVAIGLLIASARGEIPPAWLLLLVER